MMRNSAKSLALAGAGIVWGTILPGFSPSEATAELLVSSALPAPTNSFVNWETAPVHPAAVSPERRTLAVCNLPDNRLELFDITAIQPIPMGSVPVGLDPVSLRFRTEHEIWVVNQISDSVSIVDLEKMRVVATLNTLDAPADILFAGAPLRAFVSCAGADAVQVFDPLSRTAVGKVVIDGNRPKAMAASPDGARVYVAIFESGNASTIIGAGVGPGFPRATAVDFPTGPHDGLNPPPNQGTNFNPVIELKPPATNNPPRVSLIVKKNQAAKWMDDNQGDWTEFIRGTNAVFTGRPAGWDMPDHDLAVIDTSNLAVSYISGLMNICMDVAVNPASGKVAVVGTDALNQIRFEPVLKGIFVRVLVALSDPAATEKTIQDLNTHLNYQAALVPETERIKSIGDPRGIIWNAQGTRAYVSGMGSSNLVIIDAEGKRAGRQAAIKLAEGPTGLALDDARHRLYVLNRFAASISVVDTEREEVVDTLPLFDPTPSATKTGRKHLYDTHKGSGLGQAACASCHVDARIDRLAWDLGNQSGEMVSANPTNRNYGRFLPEPTNNFHPMKGPMVTQTLQDIIGHEPFHWRGDRDGLEQFNGTFTNLQGAASSLTTNEMKEFKDFLSSIYFPPNPFRLFNNSLPTSLPLAGHVSLGRGTLAAGKALPNGNPKNGLLRFNQSGVNGCVHCHSLPAGLGSEKAWTGTRWRDIPPGPNGEHLVALIALPRSSDLPFKIPSLRNLFDKIGADFTQTISRAGFGFIHDGSVDSLVRFVQDGFNFREDQETADIVAFLLCFTGSDLPAGTSTDPDRPPGAPGRDVPAAVGKQITIDSPIRLKLLDDMLALARSSTNRVDLVVKGPREGLNRGWYFDRATGQFQSDRKGESLLPDDLLSLANTGNELTYTVVPRGSGRRIGIDRDEDGFYDRDETDSGSDPANALSIPVEFRAVRITVASDSVVIEWNSIPGRTYRIQFKNRLTDPAWQDLDGDVTADGPSAVKSDPARVVLEKFYRIQRVN